MNSYSKYANILHPESKLHGVDILKYIMALGVVAIHVASGSCTGISFTPVFTWFIRLAVPFFFVTSGFLLARQLHKKSDSNINNILRVRCKKILKLFSLWLLIYLPITLICFPYSEKPIYRLFLIIIENILLRGEILYAWPLWFLYSLLLITLGLWLTIKSKKLRILFICFVAVYYIAAQCQSYFETSEIPKYLQYFYKFTPVRAISGGGCLLSGILMHRLYKIIAYRYNVWLLIAVSLILFILELPFYELFGGAAIFLFASLLKINNPKLSESMRIQSMWIYYMHMYIIFVIVSISKIEDIKLQLYPTYFIVLLSSMLLAYMLSKLQTRPRFKFIAFLTR